MEKKYPFSFSLVVDRYTFSVAHTFDDMWGLIKDKDYLSRDYENFLAIVLIWKCNQVYCILSYLRRKERGRDHYTRYV